MDVRGKQFTLLLVDDNPTNLTLLAKIIELDLPEVRVLTATNGVDGLRLAEQEPIDGAFIDVQMPQMSGLEMCRRLKEDPRTAGMSLVLITAHLASPEMRAEGLEVGAYDFISQPISNVEMLARIKVMLRLCQGERARQGDGSPQPAQTDEHAAQLRWFNGLLLSGEGPLAETDQPLLRDLAVEVSASGDLDELQLTEQLACKFPLPWRRTFLKLALLDTMPLMLAVKLSEINDVEAVFDYLQRHNLLVEPAAVGLETLQFKADVRELLQEQAVQLLSIEEQDQVYQFAADWYRQKNDPLAAIAYLLRAKQYPAVSQLLSQAGLQLLAESYQPRLFKLLTAVPEEEAVRCGWLALYVGIGYMRSQPFEVDTWLELARARFSATGDQRGELLVLSQQIFQYLVADGQLERGGARLERLGQLADQQLVLLDPYSRLKVMFSQGLGDLFVAGSLSSCEAILAQGMAEAVREKLYEQQLEMQLLQILLALFQGRYRVARAAMEQGRLAIRRLAGRSFAIKGFWVICCELLFTCGELDSFYLLRYFTFETWGQEALQRSSLGPLLNWFAALGQLAQGKPAVAAEQLEMAQLESPAATRPHLKSWLLQLRGLLHATSGFSSAAIEDTEAALELRQRVDVSLLSLPNQLLAGATYLTLQRHQLAAVYLQRGLNHSVELGEERYRAGFHAWLAALYIDQQEEMLALQQLGQLFELLRRQQTAFFFAVTPDLIQKLIPLAATRTEWGQLLEQLAERWLGCGLAGNARLVPLAHLQTLGGFKYRLNGKTCDLSEVGQSSRQLLALLAVAPNCSLSTELLMGTLWPESPASKARNSFDTALSRLRKVLEACFGKQIREDYLVLEKGMLLLRHLQVDAVEFVLALEKARRHLQRQNLSQAELAFWQADKIWGGEFLAGFELDADLPYRRDQFNQLRLEQLAGLAGLLQQRGKNSDAILFLQRGLLVEPTHDVLIQQLLDIYQ